MTDNLGLQEADYLQKRFCETVNRFSKTKCSTELSFYLPTREYTPKEREIILNQSGVDGILLYSRKKDEKGVGGNSQISLHKLVVSIRRAAHQHLKWTEYRLSFC